MANIPEWYKGRSILVTGATGFMGKVLIEKLLRSVPDIDRIYILVRPKYGVPSNYRIQEMINLPLFQQLADNNPQVLQKIISIEGDVSKDNLGINEENRKLLCSAVSVIFHIAATVKFAAPLKEAMILNVCGTENMLQFSKGMDKLEAFVHMSTTYCHYDVSILEEKLYPPTKNPKDILNLINWMDDQMLTLITPSLVEPLQNTYAFTKRLAETVVEEHGKEIPVIVVRPSIVLASMKDPIPGWVDSLNGPGGYIAGIGKGVLKSILGDPELHCQIIPVDVACNATIVAAWYRATRSFSEIPVHNLTQRITWSNFVTLSLDAIKQYPFMWPIWYPKANMRTNRLVHDIIVVLFQVIPAYFIDFLLLASGRRRYMVQIQRKLKQASDLHLNFILRKWNVQNNNFVNIAAELSETDRKTFFTGIYEIDQNYVSNFVLGMRSFCLKEEPKTLPTARKYLKFLYILDLVCKSLFTIGILWIVLRILQTSFGINII